MLAISTDDFYCCVYNFDSYNDDDASYAAAAVDDDDSAD